MLRIVDANDYVDMDCMIFGTHNGRIYDPNTTVASRERLPPTGMSLDLTVSSINGEQLRSSIKYRGTMHT